MIWAWMQGMIENNPFFVVKTTQEYRYEIQEYWRKKENRKILEETNHYDATIDDTNTSIFTSQNPIFKNAAHHIAAMGDPRYYCGQTEMKALVSIYKLKVYLYSYVAKNGTSKIPNGTLIIPSFFQNSLDVDEATLRLLLVDEIHYET